MNLVIYPFVHVNLSIDEWLTLSYKSCVAFKVIHKS